MATTIDWPSSLPQVFEQAGFSQTDQSGIITTQTDTGYNKRRRRFTATSSYFNGNMVMDDLQYTTFRNFVRNTIYQGVLSFNFPDQMTSVPASNLVESRLIDNDPLYTANPYNDSEFWSISFGVEVLP